MLGFADALDQPDVAYLAPQAAGSTWYPHSFLTPLTQNEPGLSSGLEAIADLLARVQNADISPERTMLLGFSQGACLASEFVARHPQRYGGLVVLSGGLLGTGEIEDAAPPDDKRFDYEGTLDGTPVILGCSDRDPHIPLARVEQTAKAFQKLGGDVTKRIYEGMGHTVNDDELRMARAMLRDVVAAS
jgi:predicted esterase